MIVDRFWAELFRLSSDRSEWIILNPSLLSITVAEVQSTQKRTYSIYKTVQFIAKSELGIVSEQMLDTSNRVVRVSSCFAYWHYEGETYGINVASTDDCDRFCKLIKDVSSISSDSNTREVTSVPNLTQPITIRAHIMQIFEVENDVIKNCSAPFAECVLKLTQNGALVRLNGKDFPLNLVS
ncbi:unnamed protein product [Thelazia callipaeda]|uniref:WH1 domain-containing protein n=1 Tax=Thelazia callipaeda TaxID=103827 RepID=A0A0N5CPE3_THECL|nr:unnamed protein product [Thelazia callipaeda]